MAMYPFDFAHSVKIEMAFNEDKYMKLWHETQKEVE